MQFKRVLCPVDFSGFSVSAYEYALTVAEYYKAHLVALDFSGNSERALQYAISLAAEYGAELTMLHAVEGAPDLTKAMMAARAEQLDKLISDEQRKHLKCEDRRQAWQTLWRNCGLCQRSTSTPYYYAALL